MKNFVVFAKNLSEIAKLMIFRGDFAIFFFCISGF